MNANAACLVDQHMERPEPDRPAVQRSMNAAHFNVVANNPEVRPFLGGSGELDLTDLVHNPLNIAFEAPGGGFICICRAAGVYEVHSMFVPEKRGRAAVAAMRDAMRFMFTQTDCFELTTLVPDDNPAAATLGRIGGFTKRFHRKRAWPATAGKIGADYLSLSIEAWALRAPACREAGQAFHERVADVKAAIGSILPIHEDDAVHDAVAGAAFLMAVAGNPAKAVAFYNRWAVLSGYQPIELASVNPPVIDLVDVVATVLNGEMAVLLCR